MDQFLRTQTGRFFIRRNQDVMADGRTVSEIVSGDEIPPMGLFMIGLQPGQPQTIPFVFGESVFNPGRNGKAPDGSARSFTGDIFLERDLFERCGPVTVQSLEFRDPDGSLHSFDCLTLVKSEVFHEFNVRLLDILGAPGNNVIYDIELRDRYPNLNRAHSFLFRF